MGVWENQEYSRRELVNPSASGIKKVLLYPITGLFSVKIQKKCVTTQPLWHGFRQNSQKTECVFTHCPTGGRKKNCVVYTASEAKGLIVSVLVFLIFQFERRLTFLMMTRSSVPSLLISSLARGKSSHEDQSSFTITKTMPGCPGVSWDEGLDAAGSPARCDTN